MGRPAFRPTPEMREEVMRLKSGWLSDERVAGRLGISRTTLLKHFSEELESIADAKEEALLMAMHRTAKRGKVSAIIWLARRFEAARKREEAERARLARRPA
jgi:AraC-like DNA-binding protein